jgi:PhnB protein
MEAIIPYLMFKGNAAEALSFYAKALHGSVVFQQAYGDSPMEASDEYKDRVMHATFKAGDLCFMAADAMPGQETGRGNNLSLSLNFKDDASLEQCFQAMSEGGKVTMELQDTFWGAKFGMLSDKFGFNWMFNFDKNQKPHS